MSGSPRSPGRRSNGRPAEQVTFLLTGSSPTTTAVRTTVTTVVSTATAKPVSATSLFFQLMLGLAVVLGLIWVVSRVLRNRVGATVSKRRSAPLAVLGRQPLGKGVHIAIVKAGAETFLLGITAHQVTRLARFKPDPEEAEASSDDLPLAGTPRPGASPAAFRLQSTIRQLQERSTRRS